MGGRVGGGGVEMEAIPCVDVPRTHVSIARVVLTGSSSEEWRGRKCRRPKALQRGPSSEN